ncbi:hypothetical protein [Methanolapillus millepedarum]|uniref:Uncharacterized protein n=1 Tax=Methanolapillus millepedarum TaxID=3028296 RepID=A0AA97A302_9EURY|nr:hypothetical protein MsAc7_00850 [Methanosarcinaceae archaeon Ac7]
MPKVLPKRCPNCQKLALNEEITDCFYCQSCGQWFDKKDLPEDEPAPEPESVE